MKKAFLIVLIITLLVVQTVWAVETNTSTNSSSQTNTASTKTVTVKEAIPGGTKKFVSKQNMRKKLLEEQASSFPYDLNEAIAWVRANKISILDPVTKKSVFVNIMSDEQIASFLLKPGGRKASGIDSADLSTDRSGVTIVNEKAGKKQAYKFTVAQSEKKLPLGPSQSGKRELPFYMLRGDAPSDPPQNSNLKEEYAWVRANLQTLYDPFKKQTLSVTRSSEGYLQYLLKAPQVRKNIGLPALPDGDFKKSARFT